MVYWQVRRGTGVCPAPTSRVARLQVAVVTADVTGPCCVLQGCVVVADLTRPSTLDQVAVWKQDVDTKCGPLPALLLANKVILPHYSGHTTSDT